jgi:hypothetical protein
MGLWLKKDGEFVPVSGGGGDAGSYLPLAGGVLTGDLEVHSQNRSVRLFDSGATNVAEMGFTARGSADPVYGRLSGNTVVIRTGDSRETLQDTFVALPDGSVRSYGDLYVDGNADLKINVPADYWQSSQSGSVFNEYGMVSGTQGGYGISMTANGYRNKDNKWTSLGLYNYVGGVEVNLEAIGVFSVRVSGNWPTGSDANPPVQFMVNESGPTFRAMPSKTRTVDDVLERAETAEFPPEDDEGVTQMGDHDEVPLFEVVSALLAKVKELSEEIKELKAKDRPLKKQAAPRKRSATKTTTAKKEDN